MGSLSIVAKRMWLCLIIALMGIAGQTAVPLPGNKDSLPDLSKASPVELLDLLSAGLLPTPCNKDSLPDLSKASPVELELLDLLSAGPLPIPCNKDSLPDLSKASPVELLDLLSVGYRSKDRK